jgi:PAS domain S-box-containing protein
MMTDPSAPMRGGSARHLAEIVASSGDAIIGQTLDGIVTCWNAAAGQMLGWAEEEILGQPATLLLPGGRRSAEHEIVARVRNGARVVHVEAERLCRDGRTIPVFVTYSPIRRAGGRIAGVSTILRDLGSVAVEALPELRQAPEPRHDGPATVLLVEDDGPLLDLLQEALRADGHEVIAAGDAIMALGLLGLHPEVGALVSDIVMPNGVSGLLLAREAQRLRPDLPVLLMSGYAPEDLAKLGSATGFPFLAKPFRPEELTSQVRRLLN